MRVRVERGSFGRPGGAIRREGNTLRVFVDENTSPEYEAELLAVAEEMAKRLSRDDQVGPPEPPGTLTVTRPTGLRAGLRPVVGRGLLASFAATAALGTVVLVWRPAPADPGPGTASPPWSAPGPGHLDVDPPGPIPPIRTLDQARLTLPRLTRAWAVAGAVPAGVPASSAAPVTATATATITATAPPPPASHPAPHPAPAPRWRCGLVCRVLGMLEP